MKKVTGQLKKEWNDDKTVTAAVAQEMLPGIYSFI